MAKAKSKLSGRAVKHLNKRLNKSARKGKLNVKTKTELRRIQALKRTNRSDFHGDLLLARQSKEEQEEIEESALDMVDADLKDELPTGLLSQKLDSAPKKKRKLKNGNDLETIEEQCRSFLAPGEVEKRLKHLLPIKTSSGRVVPQVMELTDSEYREGLDELVEEEEGNEVERISEDNDRYLHLSAAELYAEREKLVDEYKTKIANTCQNLIQYPQEQVKLLFGTSVMFNCLFENCL